MNATLAEEQGEAAVILRGRERKSGEGKVS